MTQSIGTLPKEYYTLLNLQLLENPVPLKKTLDFYGVIDDNAWNRPATASKKIFEFYHKDNQSKAHLIQSLKDQQIAHTKKLNHQKKVKILGAKYEDKTRLETRTLETNRLQFSSNQRLNIWEDNEEKMNRITVDDLEIKKMLAKKGIKIINRELLYNEWNNFTHMPKKTVEILANDKILNLDEKAIKFIGKKMNDEKNTQKFKRQINLMKREKELDSLRNNHLKTYMSEKKIYGHLFRPNLNNDTNKNFPYKYCNKDKMAAFLNKNLVKNELFERLSIPKDSLMPPEKNLLDCRDFRGLLIGDIDERSATQIDNEYIKQLYKSEYLKSNIEKMQKSRPQSTQSRRPVTAKSVFGMNYDIMPEQKLRELEILTKTFSDFNHEKLFEDKEVVEKQIKDFDIKLKQYKLDHPRVGFSQMKLNEAYDLSTTNGYMKRQVMKKTIPENPFEINLIKERCKNKT